MAADDKPTGERPSHGETLVSGGAGPSGSDAASGGTLGEIGSTSDGTDRHRNDNDGTEILDTSLGGTGVLTPGNEAHKRAG